MKFYFWYFFRAHYKKSIIGSLVVVLFWSCSSGKRTISDEHQINTEDHIKGTQVHHAAGFNLEKYGKHTLLRIINLAGNKDDTTTYLLRNSQSETLDEIDAQHTINVPVQSIALLHSSYISYLGVCGKTSTIKAIADKKYIYNDRIFQQVNSGSIHDVGSEESIDIEKLLTIDPDLVITVGYPNRTNQSIERLKGLGFKVLSLSEWQEYTPLGRAEWMKVFASLFDEETKHKVNERFDSIADSYIGLTSMTRELSQMPDVICNLPYKDSWFMPAGDSYMANLLKDAGADYSWFDEPGTGGLRLDLEAVFPIGLEADIWLNPGAATDCREILAKDTRLEAFKAYRNKEIYNATNRVTRSSANDYWESGLVSPEIVLADMIRILHPELLSGHHLYYYERIK